MKELMLGWVTVPEPFVRSFKDGGAWRSANPNGPDNLLAEVCALISYEYSFFGAQSCTRAARHRPG